MFPHTIPNRCILLTVAARIHKSKYNDDKKENDKSRSKSRSRKSIFGRRKD